MIKADYGVMNLEGRLYGEFFIFPENIEFTGFSDPRSGAVNATIDGRAVFGAVVVYDSKRVAEFNSSIRNVPNLDLPGIELGKEVRNRDFLDIMKLDVFTRRCDICSASTDISVKFEEEYHDCCGSVHPDYAGSCTDHIDLIVDSVQRPWEIIAHDYKFLYPSGKNLGIVRYDKRLRSFVECSCPYQPGKNYPDEAVLDCYDGLNAKYNKYSGVLVVNDKVIVDVLKGMWTPVFGDDAGVTLRLKDKDIYIGKLKSIVYSDNL